MIDAILFLMVFIAAVYAAAIGKNGYTAFLMFVDFILSAVFLFLFPDPWFFVAMAAKAWVVVVLLGVISITTYEKAALCLIIQFAIMVFCFLVAFEELMGRISIYNTYGYFMLIADIGLLLSVIRGAGINGRKQRTARNMSSDNVQCVIINRNLDY